MANDEGLSRRGFLKFMGAGSGVVAGRDLLSGAPTSSAPSVLGPGKVPFTLQVNGRKRDLNVEPRTTLLNALRNHLDLTGSKEVCDRGACGACTVWVDGKPIVACLALAVDAVGHEVTTVEGLSKDSLDPLQQKFIEHEGLQCGFCIPGFLMSIKACLRDDPKASVEKVKKSCSGNVCRCAAYDGMFAAAMAVVNGEKPEADLSKLSGAELKRVLEEKGVPRVDGPDKVTGRAKYTYDVKLPGMLHAKVYNSPFPQAKVEGAPQIDSARKVPGVRYVEMLTTAPGSIGAAVAVAIAEDPQAADEALTALKITLVPEPAQPDPLKAFEQGKVTEDRQSAAMKKAIEASDVLAENTFVVNMVQHAPLEPHGCVAHWQGDGLTVYESTQGVWGVHKAIVGATKLGEGKVRAVCEHMGGGFGCKIGPWQFSPHVVGLAKKVEAPVQCMATRAGQLLSGGGRNPTVAQVRIGASKDGTIVGEWRKSLPRSSPYWYKIGSACDAVSGMPDGIGWTPALRAPGDPPRQVVMESILDDLAAKLEMDPLDLRLKSQPDLRKWFDEGAKRIGWERRQKRPGSASGVRVRGMGVGCGKFAGSSGCDFIEVEVDRETGVVRVLKVVAVFEGGFINRRAVLNQVKGGTIMGLSWALFEERILDGKTGAMLNPNFEFYKIAGPMDVPEIEVVLLGQAGKSGGVGEAPVVPVAGALSNAIFNAIGKRVTRMPFSPRNVLAALGG